MPPQTPAQNASTNLPFSSINEGWILSSGMRRTQTSWRVGLLLGLNFLKKADWKMGSELSMVSKMSLRVAPQKTPTEAMLPAMVVLTNLLKIPMVEERKGGIGGR